MDADVPLVEVLIRSLIFLASFTARCFFAGSETAFLSMDAWAIEGLASTGDQNARILSKLAKDKSSTISALLIGTNVCTVLASVMGASIASLVGVSDFVAMAIVPLAITALLFIFSELVPKTYSAGCPTETALAIAPALSVLVTILRPASAVLSFAPNYFAKKLSQRKAAPPQGSDEPVRLAVDLAAEEGQVAKEDGEVIVGVLDSSDTKVKDVMVPMGEATILSPDTTVSNALAAFKQHRYSRVPVVAPGSGDVLGILYMKDVVREVMKSPSVITPVRNLMRAPFTASTSENLLDVLARMRKNRVHFAIVMEDGRASGIVTMEDILTEIVGDIPGDNRPSPTHVGGSVAPALRADEGMTEGDWLDFS